jgi:hypothetical protein
VSKEAFRIFDLNYRRLFKNKSKDDCRESVRYILKRNIIHGDALSLKTVGDNSKPIVFSEWSPVNGSMLKRRDFTFHGLLAHEDVKKLALSSDLGEDVFIPTPEREYAPVHFLEIANVRQRQLQLGRSFLPCQSDQR